jgi:hypothetical protein
MAVHLARDVALAGVLPVLIGMAYPFYVARPDLLIAPDGQEWAVRLEDGQLAVSSLRHDKFAVTQWRERLGNPHLTYAPSLQNNAALRCEDESCVIHRHGVTVALPARAEAALEDCRHADIVVAPFVICECAAPTVVDAVALAQHGAHALTFANRKARIDWVQARRGGRPWSLGWTSGKDGTNGN